MIDLLRLENGVGSKSRRNEQVACSEAEGQREPIAAKDCLNETDTDSGCNGGEGGGGSHQPRHPSFLVSLRVIHHEATRSVIS